MTSHLGISKFIAYYIEFQRICSLSTDYNNFRIRRKQMVLLADLYKFCHINSKDPIVEDIPIEIRSNVLRETVTWVYPDPSSPIFSESYSIIDNSSLLKSGRSTAGTARSIPARTQSSSPEKEIKKSEELTSIKVEKIANASFSFEMKLKKPNLSNKPSLSDVRSIQSSNAGDKIRLADGSLLDSSLDMLRVLVLNDIFETFKRNMILFYRKAVG